MFKLTLAAIAGCAAAGSLRGADEFDAHVAKFGLKYTAEEAVARRAIFASNVAKINAHNALGLSWTQGVNQFTTLTGDE